MAFEIEFDPEAVKDLKKLDRQVQQRLIGFLKLRVAALDNPRDIGEALAGGKLGAYWKYRVGDYRLICSIEDKIVTVLVLRVDHRKEVYKNHCTHPTNFLSSKRTCKFQKALPSRVLCIKYCYHSEKNYLSQLKSKNYQYHPCTQELNFYPLRDNNTSPPPHPSSNTAQLTYLHH